MLRFLIVLTAFLALPLVRAAQDDGLPDDPGKATTVRNCTGCHGAEMFAGSHKSQGDWDSTISTMVDKGLSMNDTEYATVLQYLSTCLGYPPKVLNINKASACQISDALGFAPEAAAAIVAARTDKDGKPTPFKDLDALKKVAGVDAAAIDAKKDSITFQESVCEGCCPAPENNRFTSAALQVCSLPYARMFDLQMTVRATPCGRLPRDSPPESRASLSLALLYRDYGRSRQ